MTDVALSRGPVLPLPAPGLLGRVLRGQVLARLDTLAEGALVLHEGPDVHLYGEQSTSASPRAEVRVLDPRFWAAVALRGSVGAGEAYMDGDWVAEDLVQVVRLLVRNRSAMEDLEGGVARFALPFLRLFHRLRRNDRDGSRRNIAAHYDLGNDFYSRWLDETLTYSAGIFEHPDATLADAQTAKLDRICRKLGLGRGDHVMEIGTGWGSFALHAAGRYGCRVTTTTISREQHARATERIRAAGLSDRVEILLSDYRDLTGSYDKLVSIEMIEAVGYEYLDAYFATCARLLKPDGVACIQAITIADQHHDEALRSVDFIQRYIFPGCYIPSVGSMTASITRATDLTLSHLEDIGLHYAATLRAWRERFLDVADDIRGMGFDERFIRMWEFYLAYCEGGFAERQLGDVQMVLARSGAGPLPSLPAVESDPYREALGSRP